jgi:sialate O-acetylesterase
MKFVSLRGIALALFFCSFPVHATVKLASLFVDNMVLQRDAMAPVWGTADPGEIVTLILGDQKVTATAGPDGAWKADFQNLKLGPPQTLTVAGQKNTLTVNNVAIGDVWVTSGQSNMQYLLIDQDEIPLPANPDIRYFECPRVMSVQPLTAFPPRPYTWINAAPDTRAKWSAVAYYFAKDLNKELGVPIGIIDCTWGGTQAEPWTSREALESVPEYKEPIDKAIQAFQNVDANVATYAADHAAWEKQTGRTDPGNKGFTDGWAAPGFDASGWQTINTVQFNNWAQVGMPNGGTVWIRKTVSLPPEAAGKDFTLDMDAINGADTTYFNGEEVGHAGWNAPDFYRQPRKYTVPGRIVKAGDNVIAIRIFAQTSDHAYFLQHKKPGVPVKDPASLSDDWLAKVEFQLPAMPPDQLATRPPNPHPGAGNTPTTNFNAMICPLMPYGIKGALWYQGESNVNYAYAYRTLLPLLIESWRAHWNIGDFPFYIVQLPNLGTPQSTPVEPQANWPVMRESQLQTWKKVPHTAMSVNIDIGEAANLHPHDKKDVGYRLSLLALANAYGKPLEYSGPIYDSMAVEGNKIRVKFTHLGGGLVAKDGGPLKHFAIAGSDQNWLDGDAEIDGDTIIVFNPAITTPVAVRYAWAGNPDGCNLVNKAGLPASPFRTDDWPVITQGMWYPMSTFKHDTDAPLAPLQYPPELVSKPSSGSTEAK